MKLSEKSLDLARQLAEQIKLDDPDFADIANEHMRINLCINWGWENPTVITDDEYREGGPATVWSLAAVQLWPEFGPILE